MILNKEKKKIKISLNLGKINMIIKNNNLYISLLV